jgi:ABC-type methionine transport system ATPase subunit
MRSTVSAGAFAQRTAQSGGGAGQSFADPSLILADQICNTDAETTSVVLDLLKQMNQRCGKTIVLFTLDVQGSGCAHTTRHLDSGRLLPRPRWN